ncbi:MAG: M28 family metallopeptidase [Bacteroidota bacterium]
MRKIKHLTAVVLSLIFSGWIFSSCKEEKTPDIPVFSENYQEMVTTLSSDNFEGRAPTTPGGKKTKAYIEAEFRRIGLKPANDGSFRQPVPLLEIEGSNFSDLIISNGSDSLRFSYLTEMMVGTTRQVEQVQLDSSELVFAGYGIVAPEYNWNDYKNIDVAEKTVIVLVNDPGYELEDPELFTGRAMTYYGRWTYKYEEAARQGAAGILIVHENEPASYGWDVVRNSWSGPQYEVGGNNGEPATLVQGWLHQESARKVFQTAGFTLNQLREMALQHDFQPFSLGMAATVSFDVSYSQSESYNIAGYVEGSVYPDETVLYMAHWDHLGVVETEEGKQIYNGAVDNATGTAALMAIAERFANMDPPPMRSVAFIALTAEESGLIGSRYYAMNPLFPLETTAGGINIDGLNTYGPTHDVVVIGYGSSDLQDILQRHAVAQNRKLVPDKNPERGYFYRSDHFSLVRQGVPMIYANSGEQYIGRNDSYAEEVRLDRQMRYHSPLDVIHEMWDWEGLDQNLWLLFNTGKDLANTDEWPRWSEKSEFRAIREESESLRQRADEPAN